MKNNRVCMISACLACLALLLGACKPKTTSPTTFAPAETGKYVVIDTDMGMDDIMAILYLLQAEGVNVKAITVSGDGLAHCQQGVENASGLLALSEYDEIPVACGREKPLKGEVAFPEDWRGAADRLGGAIGLPTGGEPSKKNAVEVLTQAIESAPNKATLLTLGPLTNLGEALQAKPKLADKIEMIYTMGGALETSGNVAEQPSAEWNIYVDPYAANVVFRSGAPITLVPLDATNQVPFTERSFQAFEQNKTTPAARAIYDLLRNNPSTYQGGSYYYWDPLAAAILTERSLGSYESANLEVVESGDEIGRTQESEQGGAISVATSADGERFLQQFVSILNGGAPVTLPTEAVATKIGSFYISGKTCTYEGPDTFPIGRDSLDYTAEPQGIGQALVVATLDEGKSLADLESWPTCDQPPWLTIVGMRETIGGSEEHVEMAFTVEEGPLYFVCFEGPSPCEVIDVLGPFEVK